MSLSQQLAEHISACFTGLWLQSHEHEDALAEIAQLCRDENWRIAVWDIAQGLQIPGNGETDDANAGATDPLAAINAVNRLAMPDGTAILVLVNFHRFIQSPKSIQATARQITKSRSPKLLLTASKHSSLRQISQT